MRSTTPKWFSLALRADETGIPPQRELDDTQQRADAGSNIAQEIPMLSSTPPSIGAYFAKELDEAQTPAASPTSHTIRCCPFIPPGIWALAIQTAIWFFQVSRAEVRVIDYYEASGYGLPHYAAVLTSRGYNYGTEYLPHDAQARQLGTGRSLWETLHSLTNRIPRVLAQQNLMDGITPRASASPRAGSIHTSVMTGLRRCGPTAPTMTTSARRSPIGRGTTGPRTAQTRSAISASPGARCSREAAEAARGLWDRAFQRPSQSHLRVGA